MNDGPTAETIRISGHGGDEIAAYLAHLDHPYFTPLEHTLNIDFVDAAAGAGARVAVELSPESARELVRCIEAALSAAEVPA